MFSNYAVGYNNVDVKAATKHGIAVGNTPGQGPSFILSSPAGVAIEHGVTSVSVVPNVPKQCSVSIGGQHSITFHAIAPV